MTDLFFPHLPGLSWGCVKTPIWSTKIYTSIGGVEVRTASFTYPIWKFRLSYEMLRGGQAFNEINQLMGFFNQCRGALLPFWYQDPHDHMANREPIGLSSSCQCDYTLVRTLGGFTEPVHVVNLDHQIFVGDALQNIGVDYVLYNSQTIRFLKPLSDSVPITWSGTFFFNCRFVHDTADFEEFLFDLWSAKKIEFQSIKS